MPEADDDVPVRVSGLRSLWPVLIALAIGGVSALLALAILTATVMSGLISVSWVGLE